VNLPGLRIPSDWRHGQHQHAHDQHLRVRVTTVGWSSMSSSSCRRHSVPPFWWSTGRPSGEVPERPVELLEGHAAVVWSWFRMWCPSSCARSAVHVVDLHQPSSVSEMAANAMGLEVLQVWGWSFYQAFDTMGDMLCRARGSNTIGHLSRAEEIVALKAHYAGRNVEGFHCWNEKAATAPVLLASSPYHERRPTPATHGLSAPVNRAPQPRPDPGACRCPGAGSGPRPSRHPRDPVHDHQHDL